MKNSFQKTVGPIIVVLLLLLPISQPLKAQETDFEGWQVYQAYARMNSAIHFEAWIFTHESLREAIGLSYLIGYMAGVNNDNFYTYFYKDKIKSEKWYEKGKIDGILDRFLYQSGQCVSLQVLTAVYFGFFDYMTPYRAVRNWLEAISYPNFFAPIVCMPNMSSPFYAFQHLRKREVVYSGNSDGRLTRSPNDYRNKEEHKNIPPERLSKVPEYEATDKPTRSKNDDRNIEEHTTVNVKPLTGEVNFSPSINSRIRNHSRTKRSVLQRVYEDWPEFKTYINETGFDNIRIIDRSGEGRGISRMEDMTIEIAIPGRQYDNSNFRRRIANRFDLNWPELEIENYRGFRSINSRNYDGGWNRNRNYGSNNREVEINTTVRTSTRNGSRSTNGRSSTGSRGGRERN